MNKQTESFLNALKDIEEGKIVDLDEALNEEPPSEELQKVFKDIDQSEELQKIFKDIDQLDAEREAWQKMFNLQSNLVVGLEMDKIRLEKEIERLQSENKTLQGYLDNINKNLKKMTGEEEV